MNLTSTRPSATAPTRLVVLTERLREVPAAVRLGIGLALLVVAAFTVRAVGLRRANELFIDELTYARLAQQVGTGHLPNLGGHPFLLHPPGSFVLDGAVVALFRLTGDKVNLVYDLRWVTALLGTAMVVLVFLILRQITTPLIASLSAVVVAFDPFVLRSDTRVMIETPTMVAVLAGLLVLVTALQRSRALRATTAISAGLLFGVGIATKDVAFFLTIVPVAAATIWRGTLRRRDAALLGGGATLPYLCHLVVLVTNGQLGLWVAAKSSGVSRLFGAEQTTGFNAADAPSLAGQLVTQATRFGTSYVLIGCCAVAGLAATITGSTPGRRLVGLTALSAGLLSLYAAAFGTLEEQYGYYVAISSVLAVAVTAAEVLRRRPEARKWMAAGSLVFVAISVVLGVQARGIVDDGYAQARTWLGQHTAADTRVALTGPTAEFAFLPDETSYGVWPSLTSMQQHNAQYVLTQDRPLSQRYGYAAPQLLDWLQGNAQAVFTTNGPSGGNTVVWQLNQGAVTQAVANGIDFRPVNGPHR